MVSAKSGAFTNGKDAGSELDVFYDPQCPLCRACRRLVDARVAIGRIRWHDRDAGQFDRPDLGVAARLSCDCDSLVLSDGQRIWRKSAAVFRLLHELPLPWRWLSLGRILPVGLADSCYDVVARHRHSLSMGPSSPDFREDSTD